MADKPLRAAVYARISDDREGRELGVARQIEDCRALADRLGWTLHPTRPVYTDNDAGASTRSRKRRPEYEDLLAAVDAGQVDAIVYYSNSRLTRRPREYEDVIALVERVGVRLASVASGQDDLTTADGRMTGRIRASIDAGEAERIGERVARQQRQRRESGLPHATGTRSFGYLPDGITVDEREANAVRLGARMMLDGASLGDVARAWTEAGILPVNGGRWSRVVVRRALTRPRIAGLIEHRGVILGPGEFDAILDRQTWEAVRAAVADRSSLVRARYHGREHLLSGFLVCGVCGGPMKVSARRDEAGAVRADSFVSCLKENGGCGHVKRNLRLAEAFILGAVEHRLTEVREVAPDDDDPDAQELARLLAERETVEHKIDTLRQQYETDPEFGAEDFVPMVRRLRNRLHELDTAAAAYEAPGRRADLGDDPAAGWQGGGFNERRELLEALVESVILEPIGNVGPARTRARVPQTTKIVWR